MPFLLSSFSLSWTWHTECNVVTEKETDWFHDWFWFWFCVADVLGNCKAKAWRVLNTESGNLRVIAEE